MFNISHDDRSYYERRAREERERALTCEDNAAALAHLTLADMYDSKLTGALVPMPQLG